MTVLISANVVDNVGLIINVQKSLKYINHRQHDGLLC